MDSGKVQTLIARIAVLDWALTAGLSITALVVGLNGQPVLAGWLLAGASVSALAAYFQPAKRLHTALGRHIRRRHQSADQ